MNNQSCGCQNCCNQCNANNQNYEQIENMNMNMNMSNMCFQPFNGCPRPQPLVAPRRVCVTQQITPVPQKVICPIECRRINRCMYYPVFCPQYEHTFMNITGNQF